MKFSLKVAATATLFSALSASVLAGGFQLTEQSALALGRAYAGVGVDGTDISGVWYNPATMVLHEGTQFQAGGVLVGLNLPYESDRGAPDDNGRKRPEFVPHMFMTKQLSDKAWFGLSFTVPFGLSTEYNSNWDQHEKGDRAKIKLIDLNPNFAYKVNDWLSVGGGLSVQYVEASLGFNIIPNGGGEDVNVDSLSWGYNLGIMVRPVENVRIGLSYRSAVDHKGEGDVKAAGQRFDGTIRMDAPASWTLAAAWDVNDWLSLYSTFRKTDWSSFDSLNLESDLISMATQKLLAKQALDAGDAQKAAGFMQKPLSSFPRKHGLETKWRDTYLLTVGYDARINEFWTLRGGVGFERSPIAHPELRTGTIPDADRWWFAIGSSFHWSKQFQTDIGFAHLHGVHERALYNRQGEKIGSFDRLDAYLVGIQAQYRF